jgi:hypothetical protein
MIYSFLIPFVLTDIGLEETDIWDDWLFPVDKGDDGDDWDDEE